MQLNDIGIIIDKWWRELPNKFNSIEIDKYIIMPNHFHGIINIINVGADLYVRSIPCLISNQSKNNKKNEMGTHAGVPLHQITQWFKTMTTNDYFKYIKQNGLKSENKLWQRNYYEHVIRNEKDLMEIREYIINNPFKWDEDRNNPKNM